MTIYQCDMCKQTTQQMPSVAFHHIRIEKCEVGHLTISRLSNDIDSPMSFDCCPKCEEVLFETIRKLRGGSGGYGLRSPY